MLAVFKTGGKQYSVKAGQILKVEKLEGEKGDSISFKDVLAISESTQNTIGSPLVEGAVVEAKILDQIRDKKIIVFKKRKRQNYRSTQGHRQYLTVLKIETISMGGKKSQSEKKEAKNKTPVKKAAPNKAAPKKAVAKKTPPKKADAKKAAPKKTVAKAAAAKPPTKQVSAQKKITPKAAAGKSAPVAKAKKTVTPKTSTKARAKPQAAKKATGNAGSDSTASFTPYVLKRNEEYMNEPQRSHFKSILLNWRNQLMEEVDRTVSHMKDEAANYPDPSDRASQEEEFSLELRTRDRERKLIRKIEKTIDLIDQDDYGYCDTCGVEVGIRRLEARPTANQCIDCKTLDELKERQLHG